MGISSGARKIVGILLFIFWAVVTAVLTAGLLFTQKNPIKPESGSLLPNGIGSIILSAQEVGKHNSEIDCWMIIDNKVYNFTSYLGEHPGGVSSMIPYCGKDGSNGFATKDKTRAQSHSGYADSLLTNYYLGNLNQEISRAQDLSPSASSAPSNNIPVLSQTPNLSPASSGANITLNSEEIAKHNSTVNCWLIINNKVYNVTSYLSAHPGGVGAIASYCGKDGTQVFQGLPHSSYANSLLANYFIGILNETISASQVKQNIQNTTQITPPPRGSGYDDDDD